MRLQCRKKKKGCGGNQRGRWRISDFGGPKGSHRSVYTGSRPFHFEGGEGISIKKKRPVFSHGRVFRFERKYK